MGFLIFAYRKLFLTRKINDLNFRLMSLSQKKQQITDQVGNMQQAMSSGKNSLSAMSSNALSQAQQSIMSKYYDGGKLKEGVDQTFVYNEYQQATSQVMAQTNLCNSVFENTSQTQLKQLNSMDSAISLQCASIESQLKQLNGELEGVIKGEEAAAKAEAPKFGLA